MSYLLDTNILLRFVQPADPLHALVRQAVLRLGQRGEALHYTSQNLVEFWNVSTRPAGSRGGFGLSIADTDQNAQDIEAAFSLLPDSPAVHSLWRQLVVGHGVSGVQVHDARLAAFMLTYGVPGMLTLNPRDFTRFPGITAVHPSAV